MQEKSVILKKLDAIKAELNYLKDHMVDIDTVLTDDDLEAIQEAKEDLKKGRTKRLIV